MIHFGCCRSISYISIVAELKLDTKPLTFSLSKVHISAEPAFVTGTTLINLALFTSLAAVVLKRESRLTFHFVVSHVKDCNVMIVPAQTKVHSDPLMYLIYRSSDR